MRAARTSPGRRLVAVAIVALVSATTVSVYAADSRSTADSPTQPSRIVESADSAAVVAAVQAFHDALAAGDSTAALALLADDAVIAEAGGVESRTEYRSHHLSSDIAFARAVRSERTIVRVSVQDDVAWVVATSTAQGTYRDRQVDSTGAELVVLVRTADGWRISAVHWSSRARRS